MCISPNPEQFTNPVRLINFLHVKKSGRKIPLSIYFLNDET